MTESADDEAAARVAQARAIRDRARTGGLRFEAYLPPALADWLLGLIECGVFADPSEAAFVIFDEYRGLEPHTDLREEIMRRGIQAALDDPRPRISHEEAVEKMRALAATPRPEPAVWQMRAS